MADNFTLEQLDAMRKILAQHDEQNPKPENVFNPNQPPKEPYRHQEFPKLMYSERGHVLTVASAQEEEAARDKGYMSEPHPDYDYSRIDRNSMKAARTETPEDANAADEREAERAVGEAERKAKAKKAAAKKAEAEE